RLAPDDEAHADGARNRRVTMEVLDAAGRLAMQAGRIEVVDVAGLRIEEIECFDGDPRPPVEFVPELEVDERRRLRLRRAVLEQWPRAEVPQSQAAERPA